MKNKHPLPWQMAALLAAALLGMATPVAEAADGSGASKSEAKMNDFKKPTTEELKKQLDPVQFAVTQQCGTEPPFRNAYWNNKKAGIYVDVVSGEALFSSLTKFDSGSGWPSFTAPLTKGAVVEKADQTHGMTRVEVRSKQGDSHLGHVFEDGPADKGGLRYCINSASLRFVPVEEMEKAGYGNLLEPFIKAGLHKPGTNATAGATAGRVETAVLAGGCFWGMEEILRKIPGVISTRVGYTGGTIPNPTYKQVCTGITGHAEAIEINFNPDKITFEGVLDYFFRMHDPTTKNRQHNDVGTQYRSAIFYKGEKQRAAATAVLKKFDQSGRFKKPVVTEIVEATTFWPAEDYHQAYLQKNPGGYNCHVLVD